MFRYSRVAFISLFVAAGLALSSCSAGGREEMETASPSPTLSQSQGGNAIKQLLDGYELPGAEVVYTGVRVEGGEITYSFQLGEEAYRLYLQRVGRSVDTSDSYVTNFEESPWLYNDHVKAMPTNGMPGKVICKIFALPWVPAAGGHEPPVSRT